MYNEEAIYQKCKKQLGLNKTLLKELVEIVKNNPHKHSQYLNRTMYGTVSHLLLSKSKHQEKMFKLLKKVGVYNFFLSNISSGKWILIGRPSAPRRLEFTVSKQEAPTLTLAIMLFLLSDKTTDTRIEEIEDAIEDTPMYTPPPDTSELDFS